MDTGTSIFVFKASTLPHQVKWEVNLNMCAEKVFSVIKPFKVLPLSVANRR